MENSVEEKIINPLFQALCKAQGELPLLVKNKKGYGYDYTDIGEVIKTIRQILNKHGLLISHEEDCNEQGKHILNSYLYHISGNFLKTSTLLEYGNGHTVDGKGKPININQAKGSCLTYARRYAIYNLLNLGFGLEPEDEDDDAKTSNSPKSPHEEINEDMKVNKEQLEILATELEGHSDILNQLLDSMEIAKLSDLKAKYFSAIFKKIRDRKEAKKSTSQ